MQPNNPHSFSFLHLLLQIENHSGYVQVDWKKVEKDVNKAKKHLKKRTKQAAPEINSFFEEVKVLITLPDFPNRNSMVGYCAYSIV